MCTFLKVVNCFEVKVDVEKGTLRFEGKKLTIDVLVSSNLHFHPLLSCAHNPQGLSCMFVLGFVFGF